MNELKSTTLELTINSNYVPKWGAWEAIREIIQNALDANDQGYAMSIKRGSGIAQTVYIKNEGVALSRQALLLGTTTKDEGGFRGKFGEGLKLALLVLCRKNIPVKVRTGNEMWTPYIDKSAAFAGAPLLKIKVTPAASFENKVEIQISNLTDEDWTLCESRLLNVPGLSATKLKATDVISLDNGSKILTEEKHKGSLFARGIYIGRLPGNYVYGYDLPNVEVDRDRKMADPWSLRSQLSAALGSAAASGRIPNDRLLTILSSDCEEATAIATRYEGTYVDSDDLSKAVTKAFKEKFGADAVPVASMSESLEAGHFAIDTKMVSKAVKNLVEKEIGTFEARKDTRSAEASKLYGAEELSEEERTNLVWAARLVTMADPSFTLERFQVVDFYSDKILGLYKAGDVRVAKKILVDRCELLATIVHEVAHKAGDDGSVNHERTIETLFATIAVKLSSN